MMDRVDAGSDLKSGAGLAAAALGLVVLLTALGCAPSPEAERADDRSAAAERALERARAAAVQLGGRLAGELGAQLEAGTPAAAIDVCSRIAPAAAADLSREGVRIRRTSLRVRNPANAPDGWERAWLSTFEETVARGDWPAEVHEIDEVAGELRFLRPIGINEMCLTCHGTADELDPEVRQGLASLYPDDRATGFSPGDLRGAFSVRVRLEGS